MLTTLAAFFGVLVVLILAHELGHFVTAKASGVSVEEFGLGFPPRLLSLKWGETRYSLNLIPFGGFVKMAGEEDPKIPRSLASKSIGTRILVLSAGSAMNFLLPVLLFSVTFMAPHEQIKGKITIEGIAPDSPAARAGLRPGDTVLSVNGKAVNNSIDLHRYIQLNLGRKITILVQRSDSILEKVQLHPRWKPPEGQGAIGIVIRTSNLTIVPEQYPFWKVIPLGVNTYIETFILFKNGIVNMIIGTAPVTVTGPVGIAQVTGEVAKAGFSPLMGFTAFLSINLAIINIFPLPALDGGRIAFVLLEGIRRGKRISPKTEALVHLIGFAMIMVFALAITYQDISRIITGESLIP